MRATIYQDSRDRARSGAPRASRPRARRAGGLETVVLLAGCLGSTVFACKSQAPSDERTIEILAARSAAEKAAKPDVVDGETIHFTHLQPFLPDRLLDLEGEPVKASTAKFGGVAVSEVERAYHGATGRVRIRIVDTNVNRGRSAPPPAAALEDADRALRPLASGGAVGYVELLKKTSRAQAELVVADRLVVTVICEPATGVEDAERIATALDLRKLGDVARAAP